MAEKFVVKPENGKVAVLKERGKEDGESNISRPPYPSPGTVS